MAGNVIAIIWDFDKTLIKGYMQDPIFSEYKVDKTEFWKEVRALPEKYRVEQQVRVNPDTVYLNHFINYVKSGKFSGLNNKKLRSFGSALEFYDGVPGIFEATKRLIEDDAVNKEFDIKLEHYIVSTGLTEVIRGSAVHNYVENIWGCEFIEASAEGGAAVISEIGYTIDNTTKTRALFEINKGVNKLEGVQVNTMIPRGERRVHFENMLYIADGPSDIPAFSIINQNGGATFAIYPKGNIEAMKQVEQMRKDGRINMFAEADYTEGSTAYMWICNKVQEFAERIRRLERNKTAKYTASELPKHLN